MCLIEMIVQTGMVEVGDEVITRTTTNKVLVPTAKLVEWIEKETVRSEFLAPSHMHMLVKPLDWTTRYGGGFGHRGDALKTGSSFERAVGLRPTARQPALV